MASPALAAATAGATAGAPGFPRPPWVEGRRYRRPLEALYPPGQILDVEPRVVQPAPQTTNTTPIAKISRPVTSHLTNDDTQDLRECREERLKNPEKM